MVFTSKTYPYERVHTLTLCSDDKISGTVNNAVFCTNDLLIKSATATLVVDDFIMSSGSNSYEFENNPLHIHIKGLVNPLSYSSGTKGTTDIVHTTTNKTTTNTFKPNYVATSNLKVGSNCTVSNAAFYTPFCEGVSDNVYSITKTGGVVGYTALQSGTSLTEATDMTFSLYAKTASNSVNCDMFIVQNSNLFVPGTNFTATSNWQRFSTTVNCEPGVVGVSIDNNDGGEVLITGMQLEKGTTATPFMTNSNIVLQNGRIKMYPPVYFATNCNTKVVSGASYGNGTYTSSESSLLSVGRSAANVFDNTSDYWVSQNAPGYLYSSNAPYTYIGTNPAAAFTLYNEDGTSTSINAEWVQMQMPVSIRLSYYLMKTRYNPVRPLEWYLCGSTDGSRWYKIDFQNTDIGTETSRTFQVSPTISYRYYRFVVMRINGVATFQSLSFFGYEEDEGAMKYIEPVRQSLGTPVAHTNMLKDDMTVYFSSPFITDLANKMDKWVLKLSVIEDSG